MSQLPPPSPVPYNQPDPMASNLSNLRVLAVFYYIIAAIQALFACLGLLYIAFGVVVAVFGIGSSHNGGDATAAGVFGGFFACIGIFIVLLLGTFAFLNFKAASGLRSLTSLTLIYVMAALACLNFPLGTVLGIFTFVLLGKPGIKESFR